MRRIAATLAVVVALLFSAGSAWAENSDRERANKLFVEAVKLQQSTKKIQDPVAGPLRKFLIQESVLAKFNKIIDDYPSTDLAVKLITLLYMEGRIMAQVRKASEESRKQAEKIDREWWFPQVWPEGRYIPYEGREWKEEDKKRESEAYDKIMQLALEGDSDCQLDLAWMLHEGASPHTPPSLIEAARWLRKAAEQGRSGAKEYLEKMYSEGFSVALSLAFLIRDYKVGRCTRKIWKAIRAAQEEVE